MKSRNSALQALVSLILYAGHAGKQVTSGYLIQSFNSPGVPQITKATALFVTILQKNRHAHQQGFFVSLSEGLQQRGEYDCFSFPTDSKLNRCHRGIGRISEGGFIS
ncbi:MAG: hypothetical protein A6F71_09475 [Cycloclasticus sp. symbiont of Poecilosclerida sp. M]|nr:MAG: hypothetical protein A6F71_09475 [Cycloclasticus sp. symbiont of Poecilosclerida sp. M]